MFRRLLLTFALAFSFLIGTPTLAHPTISNNPAVRIEQTQQGPDVSRAMTPRQRTKFLRFLWTARIYLEARDPQGINPTIGCQGPGGCFHGGRKALTGCVIPSWICERESKFYVDIRNYNYNHNPSYWTATGKYQMTRTTFGTALGWAISDAQGRSNNGDPIADIQATGLNHWVGNYAGYVPEWVQDAAARSLYERTGCQPWGGC